MDYKDQTPTPVPAKDKPVPTGFSIRVELNTETGLGKALLVASYPSTVQDSAAALPGHLYPNPMEDQPAALQKHQDEVAAKAEEKRVADLKAAETQVPVGLSDIVWESSNPGLLVGSGGVVVELTVPSPVVPVKGAILTARGVYDGVLYTLAESAPIDIVPSKTHPSKHKIAMGYRV